MTSSNLCCPHKQLTEHQIKPGENYVGKEDVCNAPFIENVEVPVGKFVTLVEQAILLLDQASL